MTRTWQDNAREFGALTRQGRDVRLALLVACSVQKGQGARTDLYRSVKVTATEFSRAALNTGNPNRVLRHLEAWDRMALAGHVPAASTLTPTDADTFGEVSEEVQAAFAETFTSMTTERPTGGRPRDSRPEDAATIIEKRGTKAVAEAMTPEQKTEMREHLNRETVEAYKAEHPTPTGTPEGKAAIAALSAANDGTTNITLRVLTAAVELERAQREWEEQWPTVVPRERDEILGALHEIRVIAESLTMNIALEV